MKSRFGKTRKAQFYNKCLFTLEKLTVFLCWIFCLLACLFNSWFAVFFLGEVIHESVISFYLR